LSVVIRDLLFASPLLLATAAMMKPVGAALLSCLFIGSVVSDDLVIPTPGTTIYDIIAGEDNLSTFKDALLLGGIDDALDSTAVSLTVFAPTNDATFDDKFLTPNWKPHLLLILENHVTATGDVLSSTLTNGMEIDTLAGGFVTASVVNGDVSFSGAAFSGSEVVQPDLIGDNGIVHKVGMFFWPDAMSGTILALAQANPSVSRMAQLISISGLESELGMDGRTIFLPSDDAFSGLEDFYDQVTADPTLAADLLKSHVCLGVYPEELLVQGFTLTTLNDKTVTINVEGSGTTAERFVNGVKLSTGDQIASNGLAHVIEGFLLDTVIPTAPTPTEPAPTGPTAPTPPALAPVVPTDPTPSSVRDAPTSASSTVSVSVFLLGTSVLAHVI
jgi:uncharacterized surface protein with fasciclin (FAS1) repeats